jgi:hypothetical protein
MTSTPVGRPGTPATVFTTAAAEEKTRSGGWAATILEQTDDPISRC